MGKKVSTVPENQLSPKFHIGSVLKQGHSSHFIMWHSHWNSYRHGHMTPSEKQIYGSTLEAACYYLYQVRQQPLLAVIIITACRQCKFIAT